MLEPVRRQVTPATSNETSSASESPEDKVRSWQRFGKEESARMHAGRQRNGSASPAVSHQSLSVKSSPVKGSPVKRTPSPSSMQIVIHGLPASWSTWDIFTKLRQYGQISRIECEQPSRQKKSARVWFSSTTIALSRLYGRGKMSVFDEKTARNGYRPPEHFLDIQPGPAPAYSPIREGGRAYPERMQISVAEIAFGVLEQEQRMLILHAVEDPDPVRGEQPFTPMSFSLDMKFKRLALTFSLQFRAQKAAEEMTLTWVYKLEIDIAEISKVCMVKVDDSDCMVFTLTSPPSLYRQTPNIKETHQPRGSFWDEWNSWYRQTDIDLNPTNRSSAIGLRNDSAIIDVGRWLTYRVTMPAAHIGQGDSVAIMISALEDHSVRFEQMKDWVFADGISETLWEWDPISKKKKDDLSTWAAHIFELAEGSNLTFAVRYQLEVCISLGLIHECNISHSFMQRLLDLEESAALRILEKVADDGVRYFQPEKIFQLRVPRGATTKKREIHCTRVMSMTITPTTMYLNTPILEPSNRVVREYSKYESHFLRVKFSDERPRGRIFAQDDERDHEIFSRIKRVLTYGIRIGDRTYEFLASGTSQFREHGAYFFALANDLTAAKIRQWMGEFTHISVVAKYLSRLGQCFSTTRAVPDLRPEIGKIPDIERNGYCFSDGVGQISPMMAKLAIMRDGRVAEEETSLFQFRLAGCKGTLVVNPELKGMKILIRPSQEKFPARVYGLEICKTSAGRVAAHLNVQIILVLSALGVSDAVFIKKLHMMLRDLQQATIDPDKAVELLRKNVDVNDTSLALAQMVEDGFMLAGDSFLLGCLRLWRCWNMKNLKEKASIFVEKGVFVYGCVDETATLKGWYHTTPQFDLRIESIEQARLVDAEAEGGDETAQGRARLARDAEIDDALPQIFLQVPISNDTNGFKIITGWCLLTRNPALHPGDARVVLAVDVPALHHIRNVVVFPSTGDRDLANMCSGGDLDGDEFLILWDSDLLPPEMNPLPMDYHSPPPQVVAGDVTVDDMTSFFVRHIKHDNLGRIAVAHRRWADYLPGGIKESECLQLAQLHSQAVDYAKTGVPALFPKKLKPKNYPHWGVPKNAAKDRIYQSKKIIGQIYDSVTLEEFSPIAEGAVVNFDTRILHGATPTEEMLQEARSLKMMYDAALRRIMAQYSVTEECEAWTVFVLQVSNEYTRWKFAEKLGETIALLRSEWREKCMQRAKAMWLGGNDKQAEEMQPAFGLGAGLDIPWTELTTFLVAMYSVTADEVRQYQQSRADRASVGSGQGDGDEDESDDVEENEKAPLMSFPWLFARELGQVANGRARNGKKGLESVTKPITTRNTSQDQGSAAHQAGKKDDEDLLLLDLDDKVVFAPYEHIVGTTGTAGVKAGAIFDPFGDAGEIPSGNEVHAMGAEVKPREGGEAGPAILREKQLDRVDALCQDGIDMGDMTTLPVDQAQSDAPALNTLPRPHAQVSVGDEFRISELQHARIGEASVAEMDIRAAEKSSDTAGLEEDHHIEKEHLFAQTRSQTPSEMETLSPVSEAQDKGTINTATEIPSSLLDRLAALMES